MGNLTNSQRFGKAAINLAAAHQVKRGKITPAQLEELANCLSNYDGGDLFDYSRAGIDPETLAFISAYDGGMDDLVDFEGGASTFREEKEMAMVERVFSFDVVNANVTDEEFYLIPGLDSFTYATSAGAGGMGAAGTRAQYIAAGVLVTDGTNTSVAGNNITVTGSPKSYQWFAEFVKRNPTRVVGMKISSTVATQMNTTVVFERQSPFKDLQTKTLQLANYQNEHTYQDKTVTVPVSFQLDDQMKIKMKVKASSTVTVTLFCGAIANLGKLLEKRAARAGNTIKNLPKSYNALAQKDRVILNGGREPLMLGL